MIRLLLAAVAAVSIVAVGSSPAQTAPEPLLGIAFAPKSSKLVDLDPSTFRPLTGGRQLETSGHAYGWSFSPDRSRLVLGNKGGELLLVDPARFVVLGKVDCGKTSPPAATVWMGKRLFAVFHSSLVREVDLGAMKAGREVLPGRGLYGIARSRAGLVMLVGPPRGIGPARLAVVDARLRVRTVRLDRITAGYKIDRDAQTFEQHHPGLAVDDATGRAFAVAAGAPVAIVSLKTLAVSYRRPAVAVTVDAVRKAGSGPHREARWLGDGKLAISGADQRSTTDGRGRVQTRTDPAGATLVDTATWTATTLDAAATAVTPSDAGLLTWGITSSSGRARGNGLRLHGAEGERFHLFGAEALWLVRTAGSRAMIRRAGRPGYDLVDLEAGVVVAHADGEPATPLTGEFQELVG